MTLDMSTLNQRITAHFLTEDRKVTVIILDAVDEAAADSAAAWAAGQFDIKDLFGSVAPIATVEVHENGKVQHYTEDTFAGGDVIDDLDGLLAPTAVQFEDLKRADS